MKIKVTQAHIDNGKKHDIEACPVALALQWKGFQNVKAGCTFLHFNGERKKTPPDIKDFMYHFDRGDKVEPKEFTV